MRRLLSSLPTTVSPRLAGAIASARTRVALDSTRQVVHTRSFFYSGSSCVLEWSSLRVQSYEHRAVPWSIATSCRSNVISPRDPIPHRYSAYGRSVHTPYSTVNIRVKTSLLHAELSAASRRCKGLPNVSKRVRRDHARLTTELITPGLCSENLFADPRLTRHVSFPEDHFCRHK